MFNTQKVMRLFVCLSLCFVALLQVATAQNQKFVGKVTSFHKIPLKKVKIEFKTTGKDVLTDENGFFEIECGKGERLTFTANGFYSKKVKVADFVGKDSLNVDLRYRKGKKNFGMATSFGHISEKELNYAIEHLEAGPDYSSYQNILEAIQGRVSGVTITNSGINIRGNTTLNEGPVPALLVVDGTIVEFSIFVNIPPTEVKSISILKGGAASARYGSRGMGGVVVVKTKSAN